MVEGGTSSPERLLEKVTALENKIEAVESQLEETEGELASVKEDAEYSKNIWDNLEATGKSHLVKLNDEFWQIRSYYRGMFYVKPYSSSSGVYNQVRILGGIAYFGTREVVLDHEALRVSSAIGLIDKQVPGVGLHYLYLKLQCYTSAPGAPELLGSPFEYGSDSPNWYEWHADHPPDQPGSEVDSISGEKFGCWINIARVTVGSDGSIDKVDQLWENGIIYCPVWRLVDDSGTTHYKTSFVSWKYDGEVD